MDRYAKIESTSNYFIEYDAEKKCVLVYLTSSALRRKLKTPMLFSYDGKTWIKTSGGNQ